MNNDHQYALHQISVMAASLVCYDFVENNLRSRKNVCLVPHVIKQKEESQVITWRCNWGNVCESKCLYAMSRDRSLIKETV